ncbi:Putative protein of unknown function [Podospora comata]|uniref:Uncharacterized protein n=1 Tax=Podospora comata TaxID=48703 RepID=A0ABY6RZP9_PODCO|nr:Putative protein of unknown function [Podospora comata]
MPPKEDTRNANNSPDDNDGQVTVDPRGLAPAWAANRTDLIESLPFFRQAQQGIYQHNRIIRGALLDGREGKHSYFDDDIVIIKLDAGGDITNSGYMRRSTSRLEAAQRAKDEQSPVGLILGSNSDNLHLRIAPAKPCRYAVLGEYVLTDLWHEYQEGGDATVTMARYQRRQFLQPPWWKANNIASARYRDQKQRQVQIISDRKPTRGRVCEECGEPSPKRYKVWVCANPRCEKFSTAENGEVLSEDVLFSTHWLLERVASTGEAGLDFGSNRLRRPTQPTDMRKGSVCPKCRKCVSRFHWASWICEGPYGCGHAVSLTVDIPELQNLLKERSRGFTQARHPFHSLHDPRNLEREFISHGISFIEFKHEMPGGSVIKLLKSRPPRTATPGTIFDDIFNSIIWEANHGSRLDLQRHTASNKFTGTRINRYEISFGEKGDPSAFYPVVPLKNAPASVQTVLEILTELLEEDIQDTTVKRTEKTQDPWLLTVTAYVGGEQKEYFKPAGYNRAGDVTATLCLGSPVRMRWRYSPDYWNHTQAGRVLDGSPLPETKHFEALQQLKGRKMSRGEYEKQTHEILDSSDGQSRPRNEIPTYLTADLTHGDILITEGDAIGSRFDSAVEPQGLLHIRLTTFRVQDGDDDRRGRGNSAARRSTSRSRSRGGISTRATKAQRVSSRTRGTPERTSKRITRGPSKTRRGSSENRQEESAMEAESSTPPVPRRRGRKAGSRQKNQKRKNTSPDPSKTPNLKTRRAAKEARDRTKAQSGHSESVPYSNVFIASSSDGEDQIPKRQKTQATLTTKTMSAPTGPKLRSILRTAASMKPKTTSKTLRSDSPDILTTLQPSSTAATTSKLRSNSPDILTTSHQPSQTASGYIPTLSRRRFIYQTPKKPQTSPLNAREIEYVETILHPGPVPTNLNSTAKVPDKINPPGLEGRSAPPLPVPLRRNPRPVIRSSILKPRCGSAAPAVGSKSPETRTAQHLPWEIDTLGVPVPPTLLSNPIQDQERTSGTGKPKANHLAPTSPNTHESPASSNPQVKAPLLPSPPPLKTTIENNSLVSPPISSTPTRHLPATARRTSTTIPPASPTLNRQRSLQLQDPNLKIITISPSPSPSPAPEPQPSAQNHDRNSSSSPSSSSSEDEDDNGASYKLSAPDRTRSRSRSLWGRLWGS